MKTVLHTDDVQPFVYKCALHFEKTRLHKTLSLMLALRGRMKKYSITILRDQDQDPQCQDQDPQRTVSSEPT